MVSWDRRNLISDIYVICSVYFQHCLWEHRYNLFKLKTLKLYKPRINIFFKIMHSTSVLAGQLIILKMFPPQKYKHPKMEKHEHYHNVSVLIYELYKYIVSPKRFSCNLKKMCVAKIVYVLKRKTGEWGSCHSERKHNGLFTQRSLRPERPGGLLEARQPLRTYPVSTPGPPGSQPLLL